MTTSTAENRSAPAWGPDYPKEHRTTVRVNGENPITLPTGIGAGHKELRMAPGFASVETTVLYRVTGGFNKDGTAKGGLAATYFNNKRRMPDGRMLPTLQLVEPAEGDPVQFVPSVDGPGRHYRSAQREERERADRELRQALAKSQSETAQANARLAEALERLAGAGEPKTAPAPVVASTTVVEAKADNPAPTLPFDPSTMSVPEISGRLHELSDAQLGLLVLAEVRGSNRATLFRAVGDETALRRAVASEADTITEPATGVQPTE